MNQQENLIKALADQQWHSGQQLGAQFGLSRTAIWKRIAQLREAGLTIESDRGRGYRLAEPIDLYKITAIQSGLSAQAARRVSGISTALSIDSTNQACLRHLAEAGPSKSIDLSGFVQLAEQQTAGKGRRGRDWVSPLGRNIYFSMIWRFPAGAGSLAGLSLVVGLSVVKALESQGYAGLALKWPNDVQWQQRKLAGILLEVSGDVDGACDVVIGIGVNLAMPAEAASSIEQPWVDLASIDPRIVADKNALVSALLNQLVSDMLIFEDDGFSSFHAAWSARDAYTGKTVQLALGSDNFQTGEYRGINPDGSITLETSTGLHNFNGGEISLRSA